MAADVGQAPLRATMGSMSDNSRTTPNLARVALGLAGLVLGFIIILAGLNAMSTTDAPPPDTPRVQTGSLPTGTARTTTTASLPTTPEGTAPTP